MWNMKQRIVLGGLLGLALALGPSGTAEAAVPRLP